MAKSLLIIALVHNINDDPYVRSESFMEDVVKYHQSALERIRNYLIPNPHQRHLIRYTPFETAGWFVFRNPATNHIHLKTPKGQLIF